jgi:hypothetical protein
VGGELRGVLSGVTPPATGAWNGLGWPDSPVTVHRVVGNAIDYQHEQIRNLWDQVLLPCGFERPLVFLGQGGDDGIVGVLSQMGGVSGRFFDEDHFSVLEDGEVAKEVEKLLDAAN